MTRLAKMLLFSSWPFVGRHGHALKPTQNFYRKTIRHDEPQSAHEKIKSILGGHGVVFINSRLKKKESREF
jgi:hypothetical protein